MTSGRDEMLESRRPNYEELREQFNAQFNKTGGAAQGGLTIRDYFAAKAMEALILGSGYNKEAFLYCGVAEMAYEQADAMMKERNR